MSRSKNKRRPPEQVPHAVPPAVPLWQQTWAQAAVFVLVVAAAWWGADLLARRAREATLPPRADLSALPAPAQEQVRRADAAARSQPGSADAVGALGRAYHASLLTTPAIDTYAIAEGLDPGSWQWTYLRGLLLEERGQLDEARAAFQQVTTKNQVHGLAWFRQAEMAFKAGALDEADRAYQRAGEAPPQPPFTTAGVTSRRVIALAAYAQLGLARVALERGLTAQAANTLTALVGMYPAFGPASTLRASLEQRGSAKAPPSTGRAYVPPSDALLDAVVASSAMRDLLLKHAAVAARGGDREWREFLVRRAAQFNPRDPNVLLELATMLQDTGRTTEALDVLKQHEQLVPGDHHTLVEEGKYLADLGRLDEAEAVLRRAVRVRDAAAEYNLGTVLDRLGRTDEARRHYDNALAIDPFSSKALNNLGVWLDRHGQGQEAIATLERAIAADPENADPYTNLGSALIGLGRPAEAIRTLETAIALNPGDANAHSNLGMALAQSGRLQEAGAQWETALRINPNHVNARRNLEQLQRMPR